ncbi:MULTISPECIES: hypothetical protein [Stutzerimonas]|uniref:hypothetical protein n=1 Tax=Stutzerimonas TaxID=2901164 RepID=UPI0035E445E2
MLLAYCHHFLLYNDSDSRQNRLLFWGVAMSASEDRRQYHALREHIDSLLAAGGSLVGRDPVRLAVEGRILTVRHGMLVNEQAHLDLIEALAALEWNFNQLKEARMA